MRVLLILLLLSSCSSPSTYREFARECHSYYLDKGLTADQVLKLCFAEKSRENK